MTDDRRAALEAIAYGDDARITPGDRLKASAPAWLNHAQNRRLGSLHTRAVFPLIPTRRFQQVSKWEQLSSRWEREVASSESGRPDWKAAAQAVSHF